MNNGSLQVDMIKKVHQTVQNMIAEAKIIIKPLPSHSSLSKDRKTDKQMCFPPIKTSKFLLKYSNQLKQNTKQVNSINNFFVKIKESSKDDAMHPLQAKKKHNKNQIIILNKLKSRSYKINLSLVQSQLLNTRSSDYQKCSKRYSLIRAQLRKKQLIKSSSSHYQQLDQPRYILTISNQDLLHNKKTPNVAYTTIQNKDEKQSICDQVNQRKRTKSRIATLQIQRKRSICQEYVENKYSPWQPASEDHEQQYLQ